MIIESDNYSICFKLTYEEAIGLEGYLLQSTAHPKLIEYILDSLEDFATRYRINQEESQKL